MHTDEGPVARPGPRSSAESRVGAAGAGPSAPRWAAGKAVHLTVLSAYRGKPSRESPRAGDLGHDQRRCSKVRVDESQRTPADRTQLVLPFEVPRSLAWIGVLAPVVFDVQALVRVAQVDPTDEPSLFVTDDVLTNRFGEPCPFERSAQLVLPTTSGDVGDRPLPDEPKEDACTFSSTPIDALESGLELPRTDELPTDEVIEGIFERVVLEHRSEIDDRPSRSRHWKAADRGDVRPREFHVMHSDPGSPAASSSGHADVDRVARHESLDRERSTSCEMRCDRSFAAGKDSRQGGALETRRSSDEHVDALMESPPTAGPHTAFDPAVREAARERLGVGEHTVLPFSDPAEELVR